jgi:hypothetical protein
MKKMIDGRKANVDIIIGVDLGQSMDYTAIIGVERIKLLPKKSEFDLEKEINELPTYIVKFIERLPLGVDYRPQMSRVAQVVQEIIKIEEKGLTSPMVTTEDYIPDRCRPYLLVDSCGVGQGVIEILKEKIDLNSLQRLIPVKVHGGEEMRHENGVYYLSKIEMVTSLMVVYGDDRIKFKKLPMTDILFREMTNYQAKISETSKNLRIEGRSGEHDDLVFALCMCAWFGERLERMTLRAVKGLY